MLYLRLLAAKIVNLSLCIPIYFLRRFIIKNILKINIPKSSYVGHSVRFKSKGRVFIGENVMINSRVYFDNRDYINICDGSIISEGVKLITGYHNINSLNFDYMSKAINVEKNCWLASYVLILPGITIPEGSVVSAGSVVSKKIYLKNFVYLGNPASPHKARVPIEYSNHVLKYFS